MGNVLRMRSCIHLNVHIATATSTELLSSSDSVCAMLGILWTARELPVNVCYVLIRSSNVLVFFLVLPLPAILGFYSLVTGRKIFQTAITRKVVNLVPKSWNKPGHFTRGVNYSERIPYTLERKSKIFKKNQIPHALRRSNLSFHLTVPNTAKYPNETDSENLSNHFSIWDDIFHHPYLARPFSTNIDFNIFRTILQFYNFTLEDNNSFISECQLDEYKTDTGNNPCLKCGKESRSDDVHRSKCQCSKEFYRYIDSKDNSSADCYRMYSVAENRLKSGSQKPIKTLTQKV